MTSRILPFDHPVAVGPVSKQDLARSWLKEVCFFVAGAIVFRLVTTLEAYLRTSGESNHHR